VTAALRDTVAADDEPAQAGGLGEMRQALKADQDEAQALGVAFLDVGQARGATGSTRTSPSGGRRAHCRS
jgi:hypothetical protein